MCGITGFLTPSGFRQDTADATLAAMMDAIAHRGPDGSGAWVDPGAGVALGHLRLAILDVSPNGAQPMQSPGGRFFLVFNGEIYNHLDLRAELREQDPGLTFRGHSDTETLLAGFERWGVRATLARTVGMFALALWDRSSRGLTLARDRFGEKPLYYGWQGGASDKSLLFGSELKALHRHPAFERRLNRDSAARFFERLCVPGQESIYAGIHKVAPGTYIHFDSAGMTTGATPYWTLGRAITAGAQDRFAGDENELLEQTDAVLSRAVKRQMISDVPLGAFLSGGIDSSTVVALMRRYSDAPIKTFTIGFSEAEFDESAYSAEVAAHLGTDHTMLRVAPAEARGVIPQLADIYDEPFADVSQIPTHIVSKLARKSVTVSLSGDGADEIFGGYTRLVNTLEAWRLRGRLPAACWRALAPLARRIHAGMLGRVSGGRLAVGLRRGTRVTGLFDAPTIEAYYGRASNFARMGGIVRGAAPPPDPATPVAQSLAERLMEYDLETYLPDDILVKVDRAAMATSLETRAPFLDHTVAEFAFRLPPDRKLRADGDGIATKWPVRSLLYQHVPKTLLDRPKKGFGVPISTWLRGPLRDWAGDVIGADALRGDDLLDAGTVRMLWDRHQSGAADNGPQLWAALMFQSWRRRWA